MARNTNIESGLQFLSRIKVRPKLRDLEKTLFPNGLSSNETVELCGNLSSGKTILLTQFIAKCILSIRHDDKLIGGLGVNVLFINTDHHFMILRLRDVLVDMLNEHGHIGASQIMIENIVKQSLSRLNIINCYCSSQYSLTLQTLDDILLKNDKVGLVVIDSIASYYWQDRESGGDWMVDKYIKNILEIVQKHTFTSKVPLIYTKSIHDDSNRDEKGMISCADESKLGKINYRIKLIRDDAKNELKCIVQSSKSNIEISYIIGVHGIVWNTHSKHQTDTSNVK